MNNIVVLDTETTGFNFSKTDRLVEIAAIKFNSDFQELARFETLINPMRDLGPQHIHGIEASWVLNAPRFEDVAENFLAFINGSVLIGHNVTFDLNFIRAEYLRSGHAAFDLEPHSLDTLRLAKSIFGNAQSCKLTDLAVLLELEHSNAHAAMSDVLATAELMRTLVSRDVSTQSLLVSALLDPFSVNVQAIDSRSPLVQRPRLSDSLNASLVTSLVEALPATSGTNADKSIYVEYLLRAIGDGVITDSEAQDLMTIALEIGLSIADVSELHLEVFSGMSALAWTDGRLSDFEKSLIDQVAKQLGVGEIELERAKTGKGYFANSGSSVLRKGDLVVLTGTMQPPKEQVAKQIEAFGAQVADSLTKKTNLLVAADPNTLSGKGQKARTWGIPIVSTSQLLSELEA